MAFDLNYLARVSSSENNLGFRVWTYNATATGADDTVAQVAASAYFNAAQQNLGTGDYDPTGTFAVGDTIFVHGSDAAGMYVIDSITTNVTTSAFEPTGSVDTANLVDLAVTTAKIDDLAVTTGKINDLAVTTGKLAANAVTSAKLAVDTIQTVSVEVSTAELLALATTPKSLVAAPGAGLVNQFLGATFVLDYNSIAYTESADNMGIKYENAAGVQVSEDIECTGFIDQTADTLTNAIPKKDVIVTAAGSVNKALVLDNLGDNFAAGNSGMTVVIAYKVIDALL